MCCLSFDDDGEELGCFFSLLKCDARTGSSSSFKTSGATALKYSVLSDENKRSQRDRKGRIREREKGREPFFQFPLATTKNNRASRGRMDGSRLASCVRRSRLSRVRLSPLERERDREMHESGRDRAGERNAPAEREGERDCSFFFGGGVNWGLRRRKISAKNVDDCSSSPFLSLVLLASPPTRMKPKPRARPTRPQDFICHSFPIQNDALAS